MLLAFRSPIVYLGICFIGHEAFVSSFGFLFTSFMAVTAAETWIDRSCCGPFRRARQNTKTYEISVSIMNSRADSQASVPSVFGHFRICELREFFTLHPHFLLDALASSR